MSNDFKPSKVLTTKLHFFPDCAWSNPHFVIGAIRFHAAQGESPRFSVECDADEISKALKATKSRSMHVILGDLPGYADKISAAAHIKEQSSLEGFAREMLSRFPLNIQHEELIEVDA